MSFKFFFLSEEVSSFGQERKRTGTKNQTPKCGKQKTVTEISKNTAKTILQLENHENLQKVRKTSGTISLKLSLVLQHSTARQQSKTRLK